MLQFAICVLIAKILIELVKLPFRIIGLIIAFPIHALIIFGVFGIIEAVGSVAPKLPPPPPPEHHDSITIRAAQIAPDLDQLVVPDYHGGIVINVDTVNSYMRPYFANVAVCSFVGPVYYDRGEDYWYGQPQQPHPVDTAEQRAQIQANNRNNYVGQRRVVVVMFALPAATRDIETHAITWTLASTDPARIRNNKFEPLINTIGYAPMTLGVVLTEQDHMEWCQTAESFVQLAAKLPDVIDQYGNLLHPPVTWIGAHQDVVLEDHRQEHDTGEYLDFKRRFLQMYVAGTTSVVVPSTDGN